MNASTAIKEIPIRIPFPLPFFVFFLEIAICKIHKKNPALVSRVQFTLKKSLF
jgi:hypothetical protein